MRYQIMSILAGAENRLFPKPDRITDLEIEAMNAANAQDFRLATPLHDSELIKQAQTLFSAAKISQTPKVIIYQQDIPNAMCIHSGALALSTGLLQRTNLDQRETIMAHEVTHHTQFWANIIADFARQAFSLATGVAVAAFTVGKLKPLDPVKYPRASNFWRGESGNSMPFVSANVMVAGGVAYMAEKLWNIPYMAFRRRQELKADDGAIALTGKPDALISAFHRLQEYPNERRGIPATDPAAVQLQNRAKASHTRIFSQPPPETGPPGPAPFADISKAYDHLTREHPDTQTRIERIEAQRQQAQTQTPSL